MKDIKEWHRIGDKLTAYLGICGCQRKLKSFVNILLTIEEKIKGNDWNLLTAEELMITALLEKRDVITHGTNCEYPFIGNTDLWEWLHTVKDNPALEDN